METDKAQRLTENNEFYMKSGKETGRQTNRGQNIKKKSAKERREEVKRKGGGKREWER